MWFKTGNGHQFMNVTLPYIIRTVENLSNNIGRLAMSMEERKGKLSIGGDLEYLHKLVFDYGGDATVADVAVKEIERLKNIVAVDIDKNATAVCSSFEKLESLLDGEDETS